MIPLRQVVSGFETVFEDEIIMRLNRKRTITASRRRRRAGRPARLLGADQAEDRGDRAAAGLRAGVVGRVPTTRPGRQAGIAASLPFFVLTMVLIVIALFNALRQPLVIWLTVPLALIGVTLGLLLTGQPFGFMALLGFLSLSGMLIKNAIVLIDEIEIQRAGRPRRPTTPSWTRASAACGRWRWPR